MSSLVLSGDTSGTVTLSVPAVSGSNTLTIQAGTGTNSMNTLMTAVTASGTSVTFTDIPAWVKRVTVMFNGVSTSGASDYLVQLGAGSVQNTGYSGIRGYIASASASSFSSTAGFPIGIPNSSATAYGALVLTLFNSNIWVCQGNVFTSTSTISSSSGGVTLSGTLDRVRITSVTPDTFDAGSINILYEG